MYSECKKNVPDLNEIGNCGQFDVSESSFPSTVSKRVNSQSGEITARKLRSH